MPTFAPPTSRVDPFEASPDEMKTAAQSLGWPGFRGKQVSKWLFDQLTSEPDDMTNLPAHDRQRVKDAFDFDIGTVASDQLSADGTHKMLLSWDDGAEAECVMIPDGDRRTACVSSQVGCPVGCRFCASGVAGLKMNLSAGRILRQVWHLSRGLRQRRDPVGRITNLVFMGMGEPLANYHHVLKANRLLHNPDGFGLGWRRITLSTVGVPPKMRQLADENVPINLALSLHAPNESLRREIIPWADHFDLADILDACRHYFRQTGREITFEYILLDGVNDGPAEAQELIDICRRGWFKVNINLLRYNEVEGLPFKRPSSERVVRFQNKLRDAGVNAHVRKSRGRDIDAACGQLRRKKTAQDVPELVQLRRVAS
jgi:23S rRNA (adenine2503-C2)-methyltransferase